MEFDNRFCQIEVEPVDGMTSSATVYLNEEAEPDPATILDLIGRSILSEARAIGENNSHPSSCVMLLRGSTPETNSIVHNAVERIDKGALFGTGISIATYLQGRDRFMLVPPVQPEGRFGELEEGICLNAQGTPFRPLISWKIQETANRDCRRVIVNVSSERCDSEDLHNQLLECVFRGAQELESQGRLSSESIVLLETAPGSCRLAVAAASIAIATFTDKVKEAAFNLAVDVQLGELPLEADNLSKHRYRVVASRSDSRTYGAGDIIDSTGQVIKKAAWFGLNIIDLVSAVLADDNGDAIDPDTEEKLVDMTT